MTSLVPAVAEAVDAVRAHFAGHPVEAVADGTGGAFVTVEDVPISACFTPAATWLGFHISSAYPDADVYPHYVGQVSRSDRQPHGQAISPTTWRDRPALQISRRSPRRDPAIDSAALKAERILQWLAAQ